jgi:drug/metabolite transporter (DMT)-like permease
MTTNESTTQQKRVGRVAPRKSKVATYLCLSWFLTFRAFGNLSLAWGAKHISEGLAINPFAYLRAMLNPFIALGILLLIGGMLSRMALLSLADLSFVLPMTSVGYIISAVFGRLFLHETVTPERWLGVVLIFLAALLVGSTSHNTTKVKSEKSNDMSRPLCDVSAPASFDVRGPARGEV